MQDRGRSGDLCSLLGGGFPHVLLVLTRRSGLHGAHLRSGVPCSSVSPRPVVSSFRRSFHWHASHVQSRISTSSGAHPLSPPPLAVTPDARHPDMWRPVGCGARGSAHARRKLHQEDEEEGRWRACFMRRVRTPGVVWPLKSVLDFSLSLRASDRKWWERRTYAENRAAESGEAVATPPKSEAAAAHHDSLCAGGPLHRRAGGVLVRPRQGRVNVCYWAASDAERGSTCGVTPPRPYGGAEACVDASKSLS